MECDCFSCKRRKLYGKDGISQLPDELRAKILSILTLREAAQTSVLCSRWKTLWTFTNRLKFYEAYGPFARSNTAYGALDEGKKKYTNWVNQVINSHKGGQIKNLTICFELDASFKSDLDNWIEFAVRNRATSLQIDLRRFFHSREKGNLYPFPKHVLSHSNMKLITFFDLSRVDFDRVDLENVLSKCVLLRVLVVLESESLTGGVTVSGMNLLKHLQIKNCNNVEFVEISAANLEVSVFVGPKTTSIRIRQAPNLITLLVGGDYCVKHFPLYPEISTLFNQLEKLQLDYLDGYIYDRVFPKFPEFNNLTVLKFKLCTYDKTSLLSSMSLFKGCPMLHTSIVGFVWVDDFRVLYNTID